MKVISRFNNHKRVYSKPSMSTGKVKSLSKLNLSIMDEQLSILNSDIEELYKKYVEKKKIRRRKEKSEQSLVSRINFLIDEERKIRTQIENKLNKNKNCPKNRSVRVLKVPEITTYSGTTLRYNTIESSEDTPRTKYKYKYNGNKKINDLQNEYESDRKNAKIREFIKKNGLNDISLSSIQNNSSIDNNNNITIGNRSTVTNNLCIIINNTDKTESCDNANNKNNFIDVSFAEKEKNNDINNNNNNKNEDNNVIKITENNVEEKNNNNDDDECSENKIKKKENNIENKNNINDDEYSENKIKENEDNEKINNEIQYIKMSIASNINEDNIQNISHTYKQNDEINGNDNKSNLFINEMTEKKNIYKEYKDIKPHELEDNLKTPSFREEKSKDFKETKDYKSVKNIRDNKENIRKENRSLKSLLDSKKKILESLQKDLRFKRISENEKKNKIENNVNLNINGNKTKSNNLNININIRSNNKIKNKRMNKRCYSKPDNKIKNKEFKTFNYNNLKKTLSPNRSGRTKLLNVINRVRIENDIKYKSNRTNKYNKDNLSIDSDEIIISDTKKNSSNKITKKEEEQLNKKVINTFFKNIKNNKNIGIQKEKPKNEEKIYHEYESTPNLLKNINITFNQSIEQKRQLLGIPINIKENQNIINGGNNPNDNKKQTKVKFILVNKNKNIIKNKKEECHKDNSDHKLTNKQKINNKSTKLFYDKKSKNQKIWNINSINSDSKDVNYDSESFPLSNCDMNNNGICKKLFKNNDNNSNKTKNYFDKKERYNKNIASNSSLASLFSIQTNKTNKTNKPKNKNKLNLIKSNDIIVTKNRNENTKFLNTIRLVKKRDKNKENKNQNENAEKPNDLNINNYENNIEPKINENKNKKITKENTKYYENEIKPRKELAAIRRINMRIANYKKNGPQIYNISKKQKNRLKGN